MVVAVLINRIAKRNMKYNPDWKVKWKWMVYNELEGDMLCAVCQKFGTPPVQARGVLHVPLATGAKQLSY